VSKLELPDSPLGAASENILRLRGLTETLAICPALALTTKVLFDCAGIVPLTVADDRPLANRIRVCADKSVSRSMKTITNAKNLIVNFFNIIFFSFFFRFVFTDFIYRICFLIQ